MSDLVVELLGGPLDGQRVPTPQTKAVTFPVPVGGDLCTALRFVPALYEEKEDGRWHHVGRGFNTGGPLLCV